MPSNIRAEAPSLYGGLPFGGLCLTPPPPDAARKGGPQSGAPLRIRTRKSFGKSVIGAASPDKYRTLPSLMGRNAARRKTPVRRCPAK